MYNVIQVSSSNQSTANAINFRNREQSLTQHNIEILFLICNMENTLLCFKNSNKVIQRNMLLSFLKE